MSEPLCRHGLPLWSCMDARDPLRAPGTDDEPALPASYVGLLPLLLALFIGGCWLLWRAAR